MPATKGNTNASTRKKMAREAIRLSIDGNRELAALDLIVEAAVGCDKDAVPALKLRADIHLARLKKILPDLRAVDHTSDGKQLPGYHFHVPNAD